MREPTHQPSTQLASASTMTGTRGATDNKGKLMTQRTKREMEALAGKWKDHIGPIDKWSSDALLALTRWLADYHMELSQELASRDAAGASADNAKEGGLPRAGGKQSATEGKAKRA